MKIESPLNSKTQSVSLIQIVDPVEVNRRMATGDTFVVNVVTTWVQIALKGKFCILITLHRI